MYQCCTHFVRTHKIIDIHMDVMFAVYPVSGLFLNVSKPKVMIVNQQEGNPSIHAGNQAIKIINQFNFLGSMISNQRRCSIEVRCRTTARAKTSMCATNKIWKDQSITTRTKIRLVSTLIFPIATYACETWSINAVD